MANKVYIVHCIDAEGPLYESPNTPFEQIKSIYGIEIEPGQENLIKLQHGEINLGGIEKDIMILVDSQKISTKGTWDEIDTMLNEIMEPSYRNQLLDSTKNGWVYSWFCLDHVGFWGDNPRRRDSGHHKVFDYYRNKIKGSDDIVGFHHHPVPFSGNFHECSTAFWGRDTLNEILTRKLIERQWFPSVFRPGFHAERPDSHWFLEQWIPFDYANQSVKGNDTNQPDLKDGRFGDWRRAPLKWFPYHPSHDNYQEEGDCRRYITRCLNMRARLREMNIEDVRDAFRQADKGETALLSFTDHDFRNMKYEIDYVREMIHKVSMEFPAVQFEYANALEGIRKCLEIEPEEIGLSSKLSVESRKLYVTAENSIFGPQPYLAIKTTQNKYYWDNFDFDKKNIWTYSFDNHTLPLEEIDTIGIAANHASGVTEILVIHAATNTVEKKIYGM